MLSQDAVAHFGLATLIRYMHDAPLLCECERDAARGGLRYDHGTTKSCARSGALDFQTDALQLLDLRSVFTWRFGCLCHRSEHTSLICWVGANYTRERYDTVSRISLDAFGRSAYD
jgi:hypothetical protein